MRFPIRLRLLANVGQNAAVDIEDVSVDEVGRIGSEEHRRSLQVLGVAPARCRSLGDDELVKRMTGAVRLTLAQRRGLRCRDVARSDAVALDVVLAVLGADVAGQHLQAALRRRVGGHGLAAQLAHHGADVDDLAVTLLDHARNARPWRR